MVGAASIAGRGALHRRPAPYGYEGLGELFVFLFFGVVAVGGSYLRADRGAALGGVRARGARRPARRRDPRGEQRARHRDRPPRGQAHAGGEARARARPRRCSRRCWSLAFARARCILGLRRASARGCCSRSPPCPLAPPLIADGRHAHRRPGAQRRARRHRAGCSRVFSLLLSAGVLLVVKRDAAAAVDSVPRAVRDRHRRGLGARARACCGSRTTTARSATARRRRSSPTTACRSTARCRAQRRRRARARPRRARPRRSRGSTCEARREGRPLAEPGEDAIPVNMTLPAGPPEEVAARAREGLARGLRVLQGQGRPAGRRRARGRGARGGRPVAGPAAGRQRAWSVDQAVSMHPRARGARPRARRAALRARPRSCAEVRERVSTPIAADESIAGPLTLGPQARRARARATR